MRGIGNTLSRLPLARSALARAAITGAAILAGMWAGGQANAQPGGSGPNGPGRRDETAMAVPRLAPGGGGIALPRPLSGADATRIRRVFALLGRGSLAEAARETAAISDPILLGHINAERYLGPHHRSTQAELTAWLEEHGTLPDAPAVHSLLLRRLTKGSAAPPAPSLAALRLASLPTAPPEELDEALRAIPRNPILDRTVATEGEEGDGAGALRAIAASRNVEPAYAAILRAELAQTLFSQNKDREALEIAGAAFRRGPAAGRVGYAGYIAGLAAWRLDRPDLARGFFEDAARAPLAPPALRAAASYWAARANTRTGNPRGFTPWLRRAAEHKRTFYGLLARRALGQDFGLTWSRETLGAADLEAIAATDRGRRLFALLQVGEAARAEAELRLLWAENAGNPAFQRALLLVAREADMVDLTAQLATILQAFDGREHDEARFSLPRLAPRGGFKVEPALVYALTRLESNFNTNAVSPAGARGLMQLMPVTAGFVAGDPNFAGERLNDPAVNLELGQRYVLYLASQEGIGNNLLRVLASYNSGPGSFQRWHANLRDDGDPLLFIEAIPKMETRLFVQRALAYSWIYAARMHRTSSSLVELSAGAFPRFVPRVSSSVASSQLN